MPTRWMIPLVLLAISSCVTAPTRQHYEMGISLPERWTGAKTPAGNLDAGWWTDFGDPGLNAIVPLALEQNYDLQAALARLDQAAANTRISSADLRPSVQADFANSRRKQNFIGFPIPGQEERVLSTISTNRGVSFDISWEVDLWGRLRAGSRVALADLQSAAADLRGAQLSIAGQTAKAWFAAAEASQLVDLSEATVKNFRISVRQVRDRFEQGLRPSLDLRLSLSNLANAEALLEQRRQQLDSTTRQLEVLLGTYSNKSQETPTRFPNSGTPIPAGLPADLVSRRPDLVSAERRLAAATERLSIARRDLYPRFSLTASTGTSSSDLKSLVDGDFAVWSLLTNLMQPIFQGGRLRANVDWAAANAQEALATYTASVLQAYAEVESALAAEELLVKRERLLNNSVDQSRAAERLAADRYRSGLEDYVTVLESQRLALQSEGDLIATKRLRLENRIDLYLALGGGFSQLEAPIQLAIEEPDTNAQEFR